MIDKLYNKFNQKNCLNNHDCNCHCSDYCFDYNGSFSCQLLDCNNNFNICNACEFE